MASAFSLGRVLILLSNLSYSLGAFVADYNETHVKNPRWPPHAKFHNGQTMSLGLMLAASSSYYLLRPAKSIERSRDDLFTSALIATFYTASALTAILYPGTAWTDPEFNHGGEQRYIFMLICVVVWAGYAIELRRLNKIKTI